MKVYRLNVFTFYPDPNADKSAKNRRIDSIDFEIWDNTSAKKLLTNYRHDHPEYDNDDYDINIQRIE